MRAGSRGLRAGLERAAQLRDVGLQRVHRLRRRILAPQLVDQAIGRDDAVGRQQQADEHRALLSTAELQQPVVVADLERPEDPELQARAQVGLRGSSPPPSPNSGRFLMPSRVCHFE